ncbi:MAG: sulfatase-like hydrolase/transferase [Planctomycetota bacterium]
MSNASNPGPPARPNILLIHSDQHRFDCLGHHGHPQLKTPNLDRLAADGVDFSHAFTPSPICSPARASLLTGRWPTQHRCVNIPTFDGWQPATLEGPTLYDLLRDAGYGLSHVGKFHKEIPGTPADYGVDFLWEEDDYDAYRAAEGLPEREQKGWFGFIDDTTPPEHHRIAWGARESIDAIERFTQAGQPWLVRWDPSEPHLPNLLPKELADLYPPESIEPWPSFHDPLENKPPMQRQQRLSWGLDDWTWDDWAPIVSRYLAEITLLDEWVGKLLATLDRLGLAENTLVIYSTDHGDLCGAHGMIDKHYMMYDDVVQVPLTMRWPGVLPEGKTCDAFSIHELDLATTIASAAGVDVPVAFEGEDLVPVARGDAEPTRRDAFSMYFGCQFGLYSSRMVRDRRWKYVWNLTAPDELYDLDTDPHELTNRIDDPSAADELQRLRLRVRDWCRSIDDKQLNEFTEPQLTTPGVKLGFKTA